MGWYKLRLDANGITPHAVWSVPGDRLVRNGDPPETEGMQSSLLPGTETVKHFPKLMPECGDYTRRFARH
jgi:hypothetical protein